ncbi:MAG: hypothetical protein ACREPR_21845 [Brasilonema sp.]
MASRKEILVIIDDLDKLDLAKVNEIYQDNIKALCQPNIRIIYTIPIAIIRETFLSTLIATETNNQIVVMPVLKIFEKGKNRLPDSLPRQEATDVLCEILEKRLATDLIESHTAEKIVVTSGGVLRELIRIANECCRICLRLIRRGTGAKIIIDDSALE